MRSNLYLNIRQGASNFLYTNSFLPWRLQNPFTTIRFNFTLPTPSITTTRFISTSTPCSKNLVVMCDGTWNTPDSETNITTLTRHLLGYHYPNRPESNVQTVNYIRGIGTESDNKRGGGAFGDKIDRKIMAAYRAIVKGTEINMYSEFAYFSSHGSRRNLGLGYFLPGTAYQPDDLLFLFGFSRGSYTARSLANMIDLVGILKEDHAIDENIERAYHLYRKLNTQINTKGGISDAHYAPVLEFRENYCYPREVTKIHFLGVFDTVGALGIPEYFPGKGLISRISRSVGFDSWDPQQYRFHSMQLPSTVRYAYHALALDEKRGAFPPTLWTPAQEHRTPDNTEYHSEQVWFSGDHSDVGGGHSYDRLTQSGYMKYISLVWMLRKAQLRGLYIDDNFCQMLMNFVKFENTRPNNMATLMNLGQGVTWLTKHEREISFTPKLHKESEKRVLCPDVKIHSSVLHRCNANEEYRPRNLMTFFKDKGIDISKKSEQIELEEHKELFTDLEFLAHDYGSAYLKT